MKFRNKLFFWALFFVASGHGQIENAVEIRAPDGSIGDAFGSSVTISESRALVGAPLKDTVDGEDVGVVYIFDYLNNQWQHTGQFTPPSSITRSLFGQILYMEGNKVFVSEYINNVQNKPIRVLRYYELNGTSWNLLQTIESPNTDPGEHFVKSLAMEDGILVIGAGGPPGIASDAVYIYYLEDNTWQFQQKITNTFLRFGQEVAIALKRIFVTSLDESFRGAVSVYELQGESWIETQILFSDSISGQARFGRSLSARDNRLAVGAPKSSSPSGIEYIGKTIIYKHNGNRFEEEVVLQPKTVNLNDRFGYELELIESGVIVSAPYDDEDGIGSGSIYYFENNTDGWVENVKINTSKTDVKHRLGSSLAYTDNLLMMSAHLNSELAPFSGAVFITLINDLIFENSFEEE